jgi:hypothetical protein
MSKKNIWLTIKDELIYWILICILSAFFILIKHLSVEGSLIIYTGVLTVILFETWVTRVFLLYSGRKISQYSDVIQRISFKERAFDYFVLPGIFLSTFLVFIYFNTSLVMAYWVYALSMILILITFINIKSSLRNYYRIRNLTKAVFDLLAIVTFYLFLNMVLRLDISIYFMLGILAVTSLVVLIFQLQIRNRLSIESFIISLLSSFVIAFGVGCVFNQSIFVKTAIGVILFYLVIALWNVRFAGKYKLVEYIPPLIYTAIGIILVFNL